MPRLASKRRRSLIGSRSVIWMRIRIFRASRVPLSRASQIARNSSVSAQHRTLLTAAHATLHADELSLLHIEAPLGQQLPLVKAGAAQRLTFGALLLDLLQADDVGTVAHGSSDQAQHILNES